MLQSLLSPFSPSLPAHCAPSNDFLLRFSQTFHVCIPTPLAFLSNSLGILSIVAWLFAQLPQIYKNWSISSTSGLSIFFLVEWCLGDLGNLLGALFTHQASWQVAIGSYYVFVDVCLVGQWVWYEKLRHGNMVKRVWRGDEGRDNDWSGGGDMETVRGHGAAGDGSGPKQNSVSARPRTTPRIIFRTPTFDKQTRDMEKPTPSPSNTPRGTTIHRVGSSSPFPSPSPRTILLIACLSALASASPLSPSPHKTPLPTTRPTPLENAGTILSWISTILYLGSRLPQLLKNYNRKSTAGLSPHLFLAAFCGNLFYSAALLTNPCGWEDFGPFGGGGWVGKDGSQRGPWVAAAMPFFLGAAGVLGLDASVGVQFLLYGERTEKVVVVEGGQGRGRKWRWREVSGWMRGWVPSTSESKAEEGGERGALLERSEQHRGQDYGAL